MNEQGKKVLKAAIERIEAQKESTQKLLDKVEELELPQPIDGAVEDSSKKLSPTGPLHFSEELLEELSRDG